MTALDPVRHLALLDDLLRSARKAGADSADALVFENISIGHRQRLRVPEMLERAESRDLGLRVFVGRRQAVVSSTDLGRKALSELIERAVAMARVAPEDPYCGLAQPQEIIALVPDLDLWDRTEPSPEDLIRRAAEAEEAALAVAGVTNSEGAEGSYSLTTVAMAATNGFAHAYARSGHSVSTSVIAGSGTQMETDHDLSSAVFAADLEPPAVVGRRAGERAVRRLNPRKADTAKVPVVFDPRVASSLLGHLGGAISGTAIARGTSFLKDKLGQAVLADGLDVIDDPLRRRGLRSRPFDGEGIAGSSRKLVDGGRLTTWILDLASARQLGLKTTGHASRGTSSPPGPASTNLYLAPGRIGRDALLRTVDRGLYVTQLMGFGVNGVTGDYSRGASGFWIENGELAYPVSEVTVAGNLKDMFKAMTPADDLVFRHATNAPTVRVDGMTVAGR